jgi:tetratricopeptide (TPR) repeat protein
MRFVPKCLESARAPVPVAGIVFFSFLFLFVWLRVDPVINYHYPGFYRYDSVEVYPAWFLTDTPAWPGKTVERLASLLTPAFAGNLGGAAVITLIAFLLCWSFGLVLSRNGAKYTHGLRYVPAAIMLLQYWYQFNPLPASIAFIIAFSFVWFYQVRSGPNPVRRCAIFVIFAIHVLAFAAKAYLVFSLLCIIHEFAVKRNKTVALAETAMAFLLPAVLCGLFFPHYAWTKALSFFLPLLPQSASFTALLPFLFWIVFPGIPIVALFDKRFVKTAAVFEWGKLRAVSSALHGMYRGMLPGLLLGLSTLLVIRYNHDPAVLARSNAAMNHAMLTQNWGRLLDEAKKIPVRSLDDPQIHLVDRALYHTGRLLTDLFRYPQSKNTLLLFPFSSSVNALAPVNRFGALVWGGRTFYELGSVNNAEHCALEALAEFYYPQGLQLLSMIYAVKGMPEAARTCLNALYKDPGYRRWAGRRLDLLEADPSLSQLPEVGDTRAILLKREFIQTGIPPLSALVRENPQNRMAFEYLIAWNLIQRSLDSLVNYIPAFRGMGYQNLPLLYEEALILYAALTEKKPDLNGYALSSEATASFETFYTIFYEKYRGRTDLAQDELARSSGDSFYFYYLYGFSGAMGSHEKK